MSRSSFPTAALVAVMLAAGMHAAPVSAAPLKPGDELPLWPGTPPGSQGVSLTETSTDAGKPGDPQRTLAGIAVPTVTAYVPAQPNGTAALITVGGGYTSLVIDKEGTDIAKWLNTLGVTAFVLKHRLPGEGHANGPQVPLQDGQRAMRLIRLHATEWGLNPQKIGLFGFSSGGHAASMIGTAYARTVYKPVQGEAGVSARPDFMVLAYGPHSGNARKYLIVPEQKPVEPPQKQALYDEYPTDRLVDKNTAPTFLVTADNDNRVDPRNSTRFYDALKAAGVPAELHVFQDGKHGFAIRNAVGYPIAIWTQLCENWLRAGAWIR